jgi:hypothetical protein
MYFAWQNTTAVENKLLVQSISYVSNVGGLDRQINLIHPQVVTVKSGVGLLILSSKANGWFSLWVYCERW